MQKWEYKFVVVDVNNKVLPGGQDLGHALTQYGDEGWELVAAAEHAAPWHMFIFKRQKP